MFSFLHPPHGAWQHKQGLHPTKGTYKSPLQVDFYIRIETCQTVGSKILNLLRFYNLLYYRGRGILLIRNPFLAIISMFRQIRHFFKILSQSSWSDRQHWNSQVYCCSEKQAPKVWPPLAVGVLPEKTQVTSAGKPTGDFSPFSTIKEEQGGPPFCQ